MANQPQQPDPQTTPSGGDGHETGHGIPPEAVNDEAKGLPTSDRHGSEVAPAKPQGG